MGKKRTISPTPDADHYDSDNGFVQDAPKSKKAKKEKGENFTRADVKSAMSEGKGKDAGGSGSGGGEAQVGKDGEVFWELSGKRRIGVQEFKGNRMINIREYYEKDGEMLPGKKGISLPMEQFNTIIDLLPQLERVLAEKGEKIGRPDYSGAGSSAGDGNEEKMEEDEEDEEPASRAKKNFEQTSDEEE